MGVRIREGGFRSHRAAQLAGRNALEDFLNSLSRETGFRNTLWPLLRCGVTGSLAPPARDTERLLEWNLLERDTDLWTNGVDVAFIVNASRGEETATTVRLSAVVAIAKARSLLRDGWQVFITAPDGVSYQPEEFDKLQRLDSALRSSS